MANSDKERVLTKREMIIGLNNLRRKLMRMPLISEYKKNGLPPLDRFRPLFKGSSDDWGGQLKKMAKKVAIFQAELERRVTENLVLTDDKRSNYKNRDVLIFRVSEFERLFAFVPEGDEWDEFYPYFDLPSAAQWNQLLQKYKSWENVLVKEITNIVMKRQKAGLKPLTLADFGVAEVQMSDEQLDTGDIKMVELPAKTAVPDQDVSQPAEANKAEAVEETIEDATTEMIVTEAPDMFSQEVFDDLVAITRRADFRSVIGTRKWVREVSSRLKHLITPEEIANIPGALSLTELERKIDSRQKWLKFLADLKLKDPLAKPVEGLASGPKPRMEPIKIEAAEVTEVSETDCEVKSNMLMEADEMSEAMQNLMTEETKETQDLTAEETEDAMANETATAEVLPEETTTGTEALQEDTPRRWTPKWDEPRFKSKEDALKVLQGARERLGRSVKVKDFPLYDGCPASATFVHALGAVRGWSELLDYYAENGFDERLETMITENRKPQRFSEMQMLERLAELYEEYGQIPTREMFKNDNIQPPHVTFKRFFGDSHGWKKIIERFIAEREAKEEFVKDIYPEVMKEEDPNSEADIVPEIGAAASDDPALVDETVQTVNVPAVHVKVPKDGKGINLTLTLNLRISFDE